LAPEGFRIKVWPLQIVPPFTDTVGRGLTLIVQNEGNETHPLELVPETV
jgi:hypothetical protein